ncbi:MAG: hypothetical protein WCB67_03875 [Solirubrobacteraceae bacterium]
MRRSGGGLERGLLGMVCTVVATAALGASSAGAAITTTAISSPASPWIYAFNGDASPAPTVTISGTSDGTSGNRYDIDCFYNESGYNYAVRIAANLPVGAGGAFSWTGAVNPLNFVTGNLFPAAGITCELRAVPAGAVTPGTAYNFPLAAYAGPLAELELRRSYQASGGNNDYWYTDSSLGATNGYNSVGDCGVYMYPRNPVSGQYAYGFNLTSTSNPYGGWDCAGTLSGSQDSGYGRSEIQIDGRNAFGSFGANAAYSTGGQAAGFPPLSMSVGRESGVGGNALIAESEGLVSCADASYPATAAKCGGGKGTWNSDGVTLSRSTVQTHNGQEVTQTDTFTSTDGQAHGLDLEYDNYTGTGIFSSPVWLLPGSSGYATYSPGDTAGFGGASTDAIFARDGVLGGNALESPAALVYNTQPDSARFKSASELLLNYRRAVPAGGSLTISHTYVDTADEATTTALVNAVIDQTIKPTVTFTAPNPGTVLGKASAQLYGTASAHDGLNLKVGGAAVAVNPDGTWSTPVSLNPGPNTITAVASDGAGNLAQATDTVIYKAAAAPTFCVVPKVAKKTLRKAKAALKKAHCRVGRIRKVHSRKFRPGRVEHASYSAGVVLRNGAKVGLTEAVGKTRPRRQKKHLGKQTQGGLRHGANRR